MSYKREGDRIIHIQHPNHLKNLDIDKGKLVAWCGARIHYAWTYKVVSEENFRNPTACLFIKCSKCQAKLEKCHKAHV